MAVSLEKLSGIRAEYLKKHHNYKMLYYTNFDYSILSNVIYKKRKGKCVHDTYNEVLIMFDTETSKEHKTEYKKITSGKHKGELQSIPQNNHVVAWTISIRFFHMNIVTLYGTKPSELIDAFTLIKKNLKGDKTFLYAHNLAYDYVFIRKFLFSAYGEPVKQLATKPHYPIAIEFENGLILKDSLILAQRSIAKWAKDLGVPHQKAIGKWDYNKIRNQGGNFSEDEKIYIEHDTLAGVECLDYTMTFLHKEIYAMPYTATGIPRNEVRERGKANRARDKFKKQALTYEQYIKFNKAYHGGYVHANRYLVDFVSGSEEDPVKCYDFTSSYPYCMCAFGYPCSKWGPIEDKPIDFIIDNNKQYAFVFKLTLISPVIKDYGDPMPYISVSKCEDVLNPYLDNGKLLGADYLSIYITDVDAEIIKMKYNAASWICTDIEFTRKAPLPRWFTDYVYECFEAKCTLKYKVSFDAVAYSLAKAKLNSLYGMLCMRNIRLELIEDYETGEYTELPADEKELYEKYINNRNTILPYAWGVYVTSYAALNLMKLQACVDDLKDAYGKNTYISHIIYSDTDSCYSDKWDLTKINQYNEGCKENLLNNGYGAVIYEGREFWLGVAEHKPLEDEYTEFKALGAKKYCGRCKEDGKLHITVAGVPKSGAAELKDIDDFKDGKVFRGSVTGKLTHHYMYVPDIYIDVNGNEVGDSIDLCECDYNLSDIDIDTVFMKDITIQVYDDEVII